MTAKKKDDSLDLSFVFALAGGFVLGIVLGFAFILISISEPMQ